MKAYAAAAVFALLATLPPDALAQAGARKGGAGDGVDPKRVDDAIQKGIAYLKGAIGRNEGRVASSESDELLLWTFLHAGVPETDPEFQSRFQRMTGGPLERVYNVALQAMVLEELERVKHQGRIAQCAQFLADNQLPAGGWSYGEPTPHAEKVPTPSKGARPTPTSPARKKPKQAGPNDPARRVKPAVVATISVRKMRDGTPGKNASREDNSNSQYAALGLRACHDAGILFERPVILKAKEYWEKDQAGDGGWGYNGNAPYGSMTVGGAGSLVILHHVLGESWMRDPAVERGLGWLAQRFSVADNPAGRKDFRYYYLYGLERLGTLYGTERVGAHDWYGAGARAILDAQKPDGSWHEEFWWPPAWNTCYAILFLRRATRPLTDVPSVDRTAPQKANPR